ncbi:MAG: SWIM zinc finger family protein [Candidatus Competibacteraceae bacterium]|jgi:hypothetical protein|nr:SWIM zinc finger family protein [Candidatus Competibacteraceae bacterium]
MTTWTAERVTALAPDTASVKAGRDLARASQWSSLGNTQRVLWGECKGSGARPYQTQIELNEPAFKCSCPSRKFPCKHALGLFLLFTAQTAVFEEQPLPDWVTEWLNRRDQSAQRKAAKSTGALPETDADQRNAAAKTKRIAQRQAKVATGIAELERWLSDLVRQGLAHGQLQPARYWDAIAARMVDAQAPGLARQVREMASITASGDGWNERLLERIGLLHLLLAAYRRLDTLSELVQADVRTAIGWTYKAEDLPAAAWVKDHWLILGQYQYEEERLQVRRTWLRGRTQQRDALILDFAFQNQPLDSGLVLGRSLDAEVGFLPSNHPLRALLRNRQDAPQATVNLSALPSIAACLAGYADSLAQQPWLEVFPAAIQKLIPCQDGEQRLVRDAAGQQLLLHPQFRDYWQLLAISGGQPLTVFGEWDGRYLRPLSAWRDDHPVYF